MYASQRQDLHALGGINLGGRIKRREIEALLKKGFNFLKRKQFKQEDERIH